MRLLRILPIVGIVGIVLLALSANATATIATSPSGTVYSGEMNWESEGEVNLHNPAANIPCGVHFNTHYSSQGHFVTAKLTFTSITFECTFWSWTVNTTGWIELHPKTPGARVTWNDSTVTATHTSLGITCRYKMNNTDIGTLTGSSTTGGAATLDISASIPFHSGSIFCGTGNSAWTGAIKVTSPSNLNFDE